MRRVHEILHVQVGKHDIVIAFIQQGNPADGFIYENVCPWCAGTIEKVTANPAAEMSVVLNRLREGMSKHIWLCTHRNAYKVQVEKTTTPLGVDKVTKEM